MNLVGKLWLAFLSPIDPTSIALSSAQVKDLVLNNMVITLGARKTVNWLNTIARRLLRPLPLKALTVLIHAFLPQLTYEGETAIASQPFVSRASLDGMKVTATAIACGPEFLHEFWFQFPSPKNPIAFWIPWYDTTHSAEQWYESSLMKALSLPSSADVHQSGPSFLLEHLLKRMPAD